MAANSDLKSKLLPRFFYEPAKFALLSFGLMLGVVLICYLISGAIAKENAAIPFLLMGISAAATLIFTICKYIKWLPKENLDRRSFIAIDNGLTFVYFMFAAVAAILAARNPQNILSPSNSMFLLSGTTIIVSIICLYVFGLLIASVYATYRRALAMGVPKWKAILSVPFAINLLWFPGYLMADDPKAKPAVAIRAKWYSKLTDWVVAKPINAILLFLFTMSISALLFDPYSLSIKLFLGAIFCIWLLIAGGRAFKKNIGGAYATAAAFLNIAFIIGFVVLFSGNPQPQANHILYEEIQVMEIKDQK
ncbi:MAG: hypothetical protein LBF28_03455 [Rickettsiales bacterium]|jgi:hypothetical protein|nr:hypothetical protein [Rickettsiales bacterium]